MVRSPVSRADAPTLVRFAHLGYLLAAIGSLTPVPLRRPDPRGEEFGRATVFFPLVGLLIGALLVGVNATLPGRLRAWLAAILIVAVWEAATGAEWLRIWRRKHAGNLALAVPGAALLVKVAAVALAGGARPAALLFAPTLARWSMVVLAVGARDADAPGRKFNAAITFREFALASVFTFTIVFTLAEALGMLVVLCVAALTLVLRLLAHRWLGGVSWRLLLAGVQGIETLAAVLFAAV